MRNPLTSWVLGAVVVCAACAVAAEAPDAPVRIGVLAESVPVDARLFLEVRDAAGLGRVPAGEALGDVLAWLMTQVKSEEGSQAYADKDWKQLFAGALGLQDSRIVELLLSGRMAIAADGWEDLSAAVLIAEPADPDLIEDILRPNLMPGAQGDLVRRYRLGRDQEIAVGGRIVVVGRRKSESGLYARTLKLLGSARGLCLADLADFRERVAEVPPGSQAFLYAGTNLRKSGGAEDMATGWSLLGPRLKSAAVAIRMMPLSLVVETTGQRVMPLESVPAAHEPPVDVMLFLPSSAVAAWTYPIDYTAELKRLLSAYPQGPVPFYLGLLQLGMKNDALENGLLKHLTGDTVFMIGRVAVRPRGGTGEGYELLVPTIALSVAVDDPESVDGTLEEIAGNLLRLVNLPTAPESRVSTQSEMLSDSDEATLIRSIPLATLFQAGTMRELLGSLELSWAVADRRLVMGTHRETVRQIVLAYRGEAPLMPADAIQQAMRREQSLRRLPEMVFVAQPGAAAEIIDSWLGYIRRNHPEMQRPEWWQLMRRQYGASQVQLGIRPAIGSAAGVVVVAETMPNYPAHERLLPGDQITAVDGRPLDVEHTLQSLRDALARPKRDDRLRLTVIRRGRTMPVDIPMPTGKSPADQVHPLALLEQVSKLSRRFAFASYVTWQPSRELVQTRLELRLASGDVSSVSRSSMDKEVSANRDRQAGAVSPVREHWASAGSPGPIRASAVQPAAPAPAEATTSE